MTFTEIIASEFYYLIEAIEHGSTDAAIIEQYKETLKQATGYAWID